MKLKKIFNDDSLPVGIGLLRISFGLMLTFVHGWGTFKGFINGVKDFPDPIGLGSRFSMGLMGFSEFICALLVAFGIYMRLALIPIITGFLVAFFIFHSGDPFGTKEMAFHYLIVFLVLFLTGPGKYTMKDIIKYNRKG